MWPAVIRRMNAILTIDIGNTSISAGLCVGMRVLRARRTGPVSRHGMEAFLQDVAGTHTIVGAAMASVVPRKTSGWSRAVRSVCNVKPLMVDHRCTLGIGLHYPHPETIGADRLANAVGAFRRYGAPVVVADFGTALTFDVVSADPAYIGGIIAPGLPLMFSYLADQTALLPRLEPAPIRKTVGQSTREAMLIGARAGYRGMIEGITDDLLKKLGRKTMIVLTGGHADWVMKNWKRSAVVDRHVTLFGIAEIYRMNNP